MDVESAATYVRQRVTAVELARLRYALCGEPATEMAVKALFADQRTDGGFAPSWAPNYSSLDATCFRLTQAEQIGVSGSEAALVRTVRFLTQRQRLDGSWEEDETVAATAPVWAQPGNMAARLYLTANCGFWMATYGGVDSAIRAADYLRNHLEPDGRLPSFLHTHWLAAGLWHRLGHGGLSRRVLSCLAARLPDMTAGNLTWLLTTLLSSGVPASDSLVQAASSMLERYQNPDGHWTSDDGPEYDVHCTLEALRVLSLTSTTSTWKGPLN